MSVARLKNLKIYNQAILLLPEVYALNISDIRLREQITRATRSISANISEGYAKKSSTREFKRYLQIALGSSDEVQTHLEHIEIIYKTDLTGLRESFHILSAQIQKTIQVWK